MNFVFNILMYGILFIGIVIGAIILFKIALKVIIFVISMIAIVVVIAGLLMVFNYATCGTPFPNGKSFSDEFKILNERNSHKVSKESPKVSKGDLSVKEIEAPKQIDAPHQIEGAKEVKK